MSAPAAVTTCRVPRLPSSWGWMRSGAVPPIKESHVEMDAAWALYESILKIRMGHAESALIYGFGKSSPGELPVVLSQQLDPYYLAPQWVDTISLAAMQARLMLDSGLITERDMAGVVSRSRRNALDNPHAQLKPAMSVSMKCWPRRPTCLPSAQMRIAALSPMAPAR